ncbi:MAG: DUF302 domain-containing protein [Ignavibacteria bacterium]|jgi:uncharacterized protein (DUF302 family)|nr:DUF302 domain-containing protein [Ignavibacteria bacterium]
MNYYLTRKTGLSFDDAIAKMTSALTQEGFGIISEIDVKETFKKKIDVDFRNYKIFGACNPEFAHKAILLEDKIGTLLPCNFIVQEQEEGETEISAVNPLETMSGIDNIKLKVLAYEVGERLKRVLNNI